MFVIFTVWHSLKTNCKNVSVLLTKLQSKDCSRHI